MVETCIENEFVCTYIYLGIYVLYIYQVLTRFHIPSYLLVMHAIDPGNPSFRLYSQGETGQLPGQSRLKH